MILSLSFKITAEIEIRKHKLMFCVLLRGGVVSALYRICSCIVMKCVYIVFFTVSSLVSIESIFLSRVEGSMSRARVPCRGSRVTYFFPIFFFFGKGNNRCNQCH